MPSIVYLPINAAMPDLVKIGKTDSEDPQVPIDQLYNTSVPVPFECVLAVRVDEPDQVEQGLHWAFLPDRFNPRRGFFKIDPEQAVAVLKPVSGDESRLSSMRPTARSPLPSETLPTH